jgi:2-iminoacetate synthase ThiH
MIMLETEKLGSHPLHKTVDVILNNALEGRDISTDDAVFLLQQKEAITIATIKATADELRRRQAGSTVTYAINRNINFTNICSIVVFVPFVAMSAIEILFG